MENWRTVWRNGFGLVIPVAGLQSLAKALREDDDRLVQGSTTIPPPLMCVQDWPVERADSIGLCGWLGLRLSTVGEVEEFFAQMCFETDELLKEIAACRWFLTWHDDTPRDEMRRELLTEVELTLRTRLRSLTCETNENL